MNTETNIDGHDPVITGHGAGIENNDVRRMFYTQEEIDSFTWRDNLVYKIDSAWYNFTEWLLLLKEGGGGLCSETAGEGITGDSSGI